MILASVRAIGFLRVNCIAAIRAATNHEVEL